MDNTTLTVTIAIILGFLFLVFVGIVTLIVIHRNAGQRRQITTHEWSQRGRSGSDGSYLPPPPVSPPLPPEPIMGAAHQLFAPDGKSSQEINGLLPPLPIHPLPGGAASADIPMHLLQEMKYLHDGGYHLVLVGRCADNAEHCIQVRWPPDVYEQASIHIICPSNYPIEAPQLIVTIDELNEYGEVVEYRLDIQSPLINQWNHTYTITQVVDSVLDILPGAMIDRSHPSSVRIMDQYSEFSGL